MRRWSSKRLGFAVLLGMLVGCGDGVGEPLDGGEDGAAPDAMAARDGGGRRDAALSDGRVPACGDGVLDPGEVCDDGDTREGDGCSSDCGTLDPDYACPVPGVACVRVVTCGNGRIEGRETCDDRNTSSGDGCSSGCQREDGWVCPVAGAACVAARCGDGLVAGFEECDDGGRCDGGGDTACRTDAECVAAGDGAACEARAGDGCGASCQLEDGFVCRAPGSSCERTTCGDGVVEGTEECDDGNARIGDGCTPFCRREPSCMDGVCVAVCGDEVIFAPEECDDGNTRDGDGCSSDCRIERGYACEEVEREPPPSVQLPIVIRDFIPACQDGNSAVSTRPRDSAPGAVPPYGHPDFQCFGGAQQGMVQTTLVDGVPLRSAIATRTESAESFALWYRSNEDYNRTVAQRMTLSRLPSGAYRFDSNSFYPLSTPLDGSPPSGFPPEGLEVLLPDGNGAGNQNFFFTSEVRFWFRYEGTEELAFSGDDDVWVFVNRRLAVDIGGVHGRLDGSIRLSSCASADPAMNAAGCLAPLDLRVGGIYEAVVFQAERHTTQSQYRLTLTNFGRAPSVCRSTCGDGIVASDEACDEGERNGVSYGGCSAECRLTPYCGDGLVQEEFGEVCDDGLNLGMGSSACAPGCREVGARCGDGVVQRDAGETCDDGNTTPGDGCDESCQIELG